MYLYVTFQFPLASGFSYSNLPLQPHIDVTIKPFKENKGKKNTQIIAKMSKLDLQ